MFERGENVAVPDYEQSEVALSPFGGSKILADQDAAAIRASCIALAIQACLAIMYLGVFAVFQVSGGSFRSSQAIEILGGGFIIAEFGFFIFLTHCIFLFPRLITASVIAPLGSMLIVAAHFAIMLIATNAPSSSITYNLGMMFSFVVGSLISGWLLHRLLGSSLTLGSEDVFQSAISTKTLLLIAPLLLVMGLIPTLVLWTSGMRQAETHFASTVVLASLYLLLVTAVPILAMVLCFVLLNLKGRWGCITEIAFLIGLVVPIVLVFVIDVPGSALGVSVVIASSGIVYLAGVAVAVAPFYWCGFRPVWAKRKQVEQAERAVSFDEVI